MPNTATDWTNWSKASYSPLGFERSQQSRGDRSGAVAIVDCWLWLMMAENLFSKTIIRQRQRFATANNSHTQTSCPRRHRLNESLSFCHKKRAVKITALCGGKRGIRTPGASQLIGFQDRRIRPLCHLSERKGTTFFLFCKIFRKKLKFRTIFCNFASWNDSLLLKEQYKKSPSERFTKQRAIT